MLIFFSSGLLRKIGLRFLKVNIILGSLPRVALAARDSSSLSQVDAAIQVTKLISPSF